MDNINKTIYIYWYGNEKKKSQLLKYYNQVNKVISPWVIELGPTNNEHKYLLENNKLYKLCFDKKIFSFCSDVWRVYKIFKCGGLYIDSGCTFNLEKIKSFLNNLEKYEYCFVFETPYFFWNGFFWFKEKNNKILLKVYKYTNKMANFNLDHTLTGPTYFSKFIFKNLGYQIEKNANVLLLKSFDFDWRNRTNTFYMHPSASWWDKVNTKIKREYTCAESWIGSFWSFKNKNKKIILLIKRKLFTSFIINKISTYNFFYKYAKKIVVKTKFKNNS